MNIYKILILSHGNSYQYVVQAYDAANAILNSGINPADIIKLELVKSANLIDNTK